MNERIEALKKLATKEVWSENQHNGAPEFDGYELDADMFAELIVAECLSYAKDGDLDFMKFMIKKHFGVEE
jgi:hypothetical protein